MEPIRAVGAMSGTSLDGVDAAEILTDGVAIHGFGATGYRPYSDGERETIRGALGRWPGEAGVAEAAAVVEAAHVALLSDPSFAGADLIGFHGQTLAHDPAGGRTHQAGDGARLAGRLGRPVAWDFRSTDVAQGGEGAPLAPAYHHACARWLGGRDPVAFLNLGGVGNLTWTDPSRADMADPGAMLAFDTGPANAPIDDLCLRLGGEGVDRDGALALSGRADADLVAELMRHPFFKRPPPKSLDRDAWRVAGAKIDALPAPDAAATWVAVIAASVARGLRACPVLPGRMLVTGGGRRNPAIMAALRDACACAVNPVEEAGLDGDMLEAQAFAYLAVRTMRGLPLSFPSTTGVAEPMPGARVSPPAGGPAVDSPAAGARHREGRRISGSR